MVFSDTGDKKRKAGGKLVKIGACRFAQNVKKSASSATEIFRRLP